MFARIEPLRSWDDGPVIDADGFGQYQLPSFYAQPADIGFRILGVPLYKTGIWDIDIANYGLARHLDGSGSIWRTMLYSASTGQTSGQTTCMGSVTRQNATRAMVVMGQRQGDYKMAKQYGMRWHMRTPILRYQKAVTTAWQLVRTPPALAYLLGGKQPKDFTEANNALANLPVEIRKRQSQKMLLEDSVHANELELAKLKASLGLSDYVIRRIAAPARHTPVQIADHTEEWTYQTMPWVGIGDVQCALQVPSEASQPVPTMEELVANVTSFYPVLGTYIPTSGTLTARANAYAKALDQDVSTLRNLMVEIPKLEQRLVALRAEIEQIKRTPPPPEPEPKPLPEEPVPEPPTPIAAPTEPVPLPAPEPAPTPAPKVEIVTTGPTSPAPKPTPPPGVPAVMPEAPVVSAPGQTPEAAEKEATKQAIKRAATTALVVWAIRQVLG